MLRNNKPLLLMHASAPGLSYKICSDFYLKLEKKFIYRMMWKRTGFIIIPPKRYVPYDTMYPKYDNLHTWREKKKNGQLSEKESDQLEAAEQLEQQRGKHPIIAEKNSLGEIESFATASHAPKLPKKLGGTPGIELSNPKDEIPIYAFPTKKIETTSSELYQKDTTIAPDRSYAESILNELKKKCPNNYLYCVYV